MKGLRSVAVALSLTLSAVSSSYAIFGIGAHWGFDFSLSMDDPKDEKVGIPLPSEVSDQIGDNEFFRLSRKNFKASAINFGGKVFIDFIPVIDAIEASCNFGLWQYDGVLNYVSNLDDVVANNAKPAYENVVPLGLDAQGLKYIGLSGTPYAKLQLDLSVRKNVFKLPADVFKFNAGAGMSVQFATPLLTAKLVEDVVGVVSDADWDSFIEDLAKTGGDSKYGKNIVQKIIDDALGKPVYGMHIVAGVSFKLPMIPLGVYADGKYMIPFSKFDDDERISGFGFLLNAGLMFAI